MERKSWWRILPVLALVLLAAGLFTACGDSQPTKGGSGKAFADEYNASDTWTVYWYLCGSDLETRIGAATMDFSEILDVDLPENVQVVVQTGGAAQWQNSAVPNDAIARFLVNKDGVSELERLPDADMGDPNTLEDFLRYGEENFPSDHKVFIFWDHGGGSAAGVCLDERTGNILSLNDIETAFGNVFQANPKNPPFEIVGFDACLMATYASMNAVHGYTRYVVASEEVEPGNGWYYTGWLGDLAKNPAMGGAKLGKSIADSYYKGCQDVGTEDAATLSVLDESQMERLTEAYENFGREALVEAQKDPQRFFSRLSRSASSAENYGGNTREQGFTNMVDLGGLVREADQLVPQSGKELQDAIDAAVVYSINGPYRRDGFGIASYYSYNGDPDNFLAYANQDAASEGSKYLMYYLLTGEMAEGAEEFIAARTTPAPPAPQAFSPPTQTGQLFSVASLEDTQADIDDDGNAFVVLTQEQMDMIDSVRCQLFYFDEAKNLMLVLGSDANVVGDWDAGRFTDNFYGTWPMLDGHPVYIEVTALTDDYVLYAVPIKLNGEEMNLIVSYSFDTETFDILGARRPIDDRTGMADKQLRKLVPGDTITTLHYMTTIDAGAEGLQEVEIDTFQVTADTKVEDDEVGDGSYGYFFEFVPPASTETALSTFIRYDIVNGEITTTVY